MRAAALERRVAANTARFDRPRRWDPDYPAEEPAEHHPAAEPAARKAAPRKRAPRVKKPLPLEEALRRLDEDAQALLARMPTEQEIADAIRHRGIGAVLVDICADLGITSEHPLWREIWELVDAFGEYYGNDRHDLLDSMIQRVGKVVTEIPGDIPPLAPAAWEFAAASAAAPAAAPTATGPP